MKYVVYFFFFILFTGCASHKYHEFDLQQRALIRSETLPEKHQPKTELFAAIPQSHIRERAQIFTLSKQQKADFKRFMSRGIINDTPKHRLMVDYLFKFTDDFNFKGETYSASEALQYKSGNCLSLAIVSTALAELAGLEYSYRKVHSAPIYEQLDDLQLISTHVNFKVYGEITKETKLLYHRNTITVDYFPSAGAVQSTKANKQDVVIMYWHNLASEALLNGDLDHAFAYTQQAFALDPYEPDTLNYLAVLYGRKGDQDSAKALYEYMYEYKITSFSMLDNYANLLKIQGNEKLAKQIALEIAHVNEENPYYWLEKGKEYLAKMEYRTAEKFFIKSTEYGPYLHRPQFYLSQAYLGLNKTRQARDALKKAKELAYINEDEILYQAKLDSF